MARLASPDDFVFLAALLLFLLLGFELGTGDGEASRASAFILPSCAAIRSLIRAAYDSLAALVSAIACMALIFLEDLLLVLAFLADWLLTLACSIMLRRWLKLTAEPDPGDFLGDEEVVGTGCDRGMAASYCCFLGRPTPRDLLRFDLPSSLTLADTSDRSS